jgi:Protein similar to CwfJ C-terminus 2
MPSESSRQVPLQFGREWVAKLLGCPERVDWKQCAVGKKEEEKLVENFVKHFREFDPST